MNKAKWEKVKNLFNEAVEVEPPHRTAFLNSKLIDDAEIKAELEKLLASDFTNETLPDLFAPGQLFENPDPVGQTIGKYRVLREIGRGGMGIVYLAARQDLDKKVAIKIVRRGMDSAELLARFEHERQILATLDHPHIARLIDADTTPDGMPYYVMDYVEGSDLLEFSDSRALSIRQRLEVFRKICSAVQYAHTRLVVHRDLKPTNILVTPDGTPKLLDFGIAKILSGDGQQGTATQLGMMTPNYASPEQFRGETVTTSTDIYSLGVILYELLSGFLPYDLKNRRLDEMLEIICKTNPRKPSRAGLAGTRSQSDSQSNSQSVIYNPKLKGDLDNIILKALKKEPERRYVSAEQFSEDIRRHLEGLPVSARSDTIGYRTSKFIRRNKMTVAAGVLLFISLIGGIIGTSYQASIAQRERARAERRFEEMRKLTNRLIFKYNDAIANLPGATATREIFVKEAAEYLDGLAAEETTDKELQIELANAFLKVGDLQGEVYGSNLGDTKGAAESYQKSLALGEKLNALYPEDTDVKNAYSRALKLYGRILTRQGIWQQAIENLNNSIKIRENLLLSDAGDYEQSQELADSYIALGDALSRQRQNGFTKEDERQIYETFGKALQISAQLIAQPTFTTPDLRLFAVANQRLGNFVCQNNLFADRYAKSVEFHNKSVEYFLKALKSKPNNFTAKRDYADALLMRGYPLALSGKGTQAAADCREAAKTIESLSVSDPKNLELRFDLAMTYFQSSIVSVEINAWRQAESEMKKSVEMLADLRENNLLNREITDNLKYAYLRLVTIEKRLKKFQEAEKYQNKFDELGDAGEL